MPRTVGAAERERPVRPEDFDRLPKRFRDYIQALERQISEAQGILEELPESPVWIETYSRSQVRRYLPKDVRVNFQTDTGKVEVCLGYRRGTGSVQVSSPDGRLIVLPEVSNEIGVKVRDI
jgi:hypothetical protein